MNTPLIPQFETLEVVKDYGEQEDFFRLINHNGDEIQLQKLPFQKQLPLPDQLTCRVKVGFKGELYYTHNVSQYVKKFYGADHKAGKDFEFTIERVPYNSGDPYLLLDGNGIQFRLYEKGPKLTRGQNVRCRFTRMDNTGFALAMSEQSLSTTLHPMKYIMGEVMGVEHYNWRHIQAIFRFAPFLSEAREEFAHHRGSWVLTMLRAAHANLIDIIVRTNLRTRGKLLYKSLQYLERLAMFLLEGSSFLRGLSAERRHSLQQEITAIAESLQPCKHALKIMHDGTEVEFIEHLLDKLKKSGFIYHPTNQFTVLMIIFRQRPERVGEMFGRIYDAIMEWSLPTWTNEPFRSAFVEQFELYINEMRRSIDMCPQADTLHEKARIENVLKALALQQCIADSTTYANYSRNRSLFYRYVSLLRPSSADVLIDKAFQALDGQYSEKDINYANIKETAKLMTDASVPSLMNLQTPTVKRFRGVGADIEIHDNHLTVRAHGDSQTGGNLLPNGMVEWLTPEILAPGIKRLTPSTLKKIRAHDELWRDITQKMTAAPVVREDIPIIQTPPAVGDEVLIVIDEVIPDINGTNPRFVCHIDDENFIGSGYFMRSSLVGYHLKTVERWAYTGRSGHPVHLVAKVVGVNGDEFVFDPRVGLHEWIDTNLMVGQEINAVIASHNPATDDYSAISDIGIGMLLQAPDNLPDNVTVGPQTVVRVLVTQTSDYERVRGEIIGLAEPEFHLGKDQAIANLLHNIDYVDDIEEENEHDDEDEVLSRDDIHEIIELYRMKAVGSDEVIKAYDYLRLGCLLAEIIGDKNQAADLGLHAALLQMHVDFADNRRVDIDKLEAIRPSIEAGSLAERIFRRMEIVSWLGRHEFNTELWAQSEHPDSELEGKFARMVLSYNLLVSGVLQENDYARRIKDDICALLKVNADRQTLKYYGCESQYCEFKSSMVFCANDGVKRTPEEAMRRQLFEIMHIIAGFMNTTGGKLYIGVNDQHYERGLDEDFKFLRLPQSSDLLKRMDELLNFLTMRVAEYFGRTASTLVHIAVDEESSKGVLIVTVSPSRQPIELQGKIFVRLSTSTVPILEAEELKSFREGRALAYDDMMKMRAADFAYGADADTQPVVNEVATEPEMTDAASGETPTASADSAAPAETPAPADDGDSSEPRSVLLDELTAGNRIATSQWRPNVLHDDCIHEYVLPERYLYFMGDNHYSLSKADYWTDQDPECRLGLVILQDDLDAYLVLAYEGEQMIRIPVSQLMERAENRNHRYWADQRLLWATIAHEGDAVLSVHADSAGGLHYRATQVADIAKGSMTNAPTRIMNVAVDRTVGYELIPQRNMSQFKNAMADNLHSRQIGYTLRARLDTPDSVEKIQRLYNTCGLN